MNIPARGQIPARYRQLAVFVILFALLPLIVRSPYWLSTLVFIGIASILTLGLILLLGYAGQISLGHNAFYGLGAYVSAIATTKLGLSPWVGILLSVLLNGALAALLAKPVFKLKGHFLAMATLGVGFVFYIGFNELGDLTGGPSGLSGLPYLSIGGLVFDTDLKYYYLTLAALAITLFFALNVASLRVGRALRALHDSEIATQAMGADIANLKAQIFVISCVYAGFAGSLYAHYVTFVNPSPFKVHTAIMMLVMAAVGGMSTVWGAPFGAAAVTLLTEVLRSLIPKLSNHASGEYEIVAFGILLILTILFMPQGVVQGLSDLVRRRLGPGLTRPFREAKAWTLSTRMRRGLREEN